MSHAATDESENRTIKAHPVTSWDLQSRCPPTPDVGRLEGTEVRKVILHLGLACSAVLLPAGFHKQLLLLFVYACMVFILSKQY